MEVFPEFPWFSQLFHGSASLIQMNYLSQKVSPAVFFWVCGFNNISLANEFDYYISMYERMCLHLHVCINNCISPNYTAELEICIWIHLYAVFRGKPTRAYMFTLQLKIPENYECKPELCGMKFDAAFWNPKVWVY